MHERAHLFSGGTVGDAPQLKPGRKIAAGALDGLDGPDGMAPPEARRVVGFVEW